jgi:two-component system sensor kinase FixL
MPDTAAEEHLSKVQERFEATFEQSAVGIAYVGLGGRLRRTNERFRGLLGYDTADLYGTRLQELTHLDDGAASERHVADLLGGSIPHYTTEKRLLRKDGSALWTSVTRSVVRTSGGEPDYFVVVVEDISVQKAAQAALQESEGYLRSILDTVPDGMVVIDGRGMIDMFSKTAERVFGYEASEVVGKNLSILMPNGDRERHDGYLENFHATGVRKIIGIGRLVLGERKDGSTFPLRLTVGEVPGWDRFVGFVRDMTEPQETEASLRQMQAELVHMSRYTALGEMASALAHELNQPLTAIANYLKGCRRLIDRGEMEAPPLLREAIDEAADQALRAGQIIRRLRDFVARGDSERRREDLPKLIDEACALALVGVRESGVRVVFELDPVARHVHADRIQIQQVLVNLIRNAVEAMQDEPVRTLSISSASALEGMVEIGVRDTGPGLDPEVASHLFQPFVTTKKTGMGVGLSICRTIVEAHEGKIWANVTSTGETAFHFTLPEDGR